MTDLPFRFVTSFPQSRAYLEKTTGLSIETVSPERAESAVFVVCGERKDLPPEFDGFYTDCVDCGRPIGYSVHAPLTPIKVCGGCGQTRALQLLREAKKGN